MNIELFFTFDLVLVQSSLPTISPPIISFCRSRGTPVSVCVCVCVCVCWEKMGGEEMGGGEDGRGGGGGGGEMRGEDCGRGIGVSV